MAEGLIKIFVGAAICMCIILACLHYRAKRKHDELAEARIEIAMTTISVVATLLALVLPGSLEVRGWYIEQNAESVTNNSAVIGRDNNGSVVGLNNGTINNVYAPVGSGDVGGAADIQAEPNNVQQTDTWVVGWSDSTGGRNVYTLEEINDGALDHQIVFNSIVDEGKDLPLSDERNFVGARINDGNNLGKQNVWIGNTIEAVEGKSYLVRLYAHNNSRLGELDAAHDVSVRFVISEPRHVLSNDIALEGFDSSDGYYAVAVHGYINVPGQPISWYTDGVKFVSDRPFRLEYIPGTAGFENNGIGNAENQGYRLDDSIVTNGVLIGYDVMDGTIPACYQYDSYTAIIVVPVFGKSRTLPE